MLVRLLFFFLLSFLLSPLGGCLPSVFPRHTCICLSRPFAFLVEGRAEVGEGREPFDGYTEHHERHVLWDPVPHTRHLPIGAMVGARPKEGSKSILGNPTICWSNSILLISFLRRSRQGLATTGAPLGEEKYHGKHTHWAKVVLSRAVRRGD